VANVGGADLEYMISVVYDIPTKKQVVVPASESVFFAKGNVELALSPNASNGGYPPPTDDVTLNYDGPNVSAVGLTAPGTWQGAAKFPASMVNEYAGMELTQVRIFINEVDAADEFAARIYGMNLDYLPGPILAEESFSALALDWNVIDLAVPVAVTGEDIWVACYVNQAALTYPLGVDGGPANFNGNWFSAGPGWSHLTSGDYNWNIQAVLTGDPIEGWLSVSPEMGTVTAGSFDEVMVSYDATNLVEGVYMADLVFTSNDPAHQYMEVPVTLTVEGGIGIGEEETSRIEMLVYPNPTNNVLNVQSNLNIEKLSIYNHIGQAVQEVMVNEKTASINVSSIESGVYFVRIETAEGYSTQKLVIE
jgi:hypothetical protein